MFLRYILKGCDVEVIHLKKIMHHLLYLHYNFVHCEIPA